MNLRLKLLLMFALGELLLLTFFGFIAYDTAKQTNIKNEIELLSSVTPRLADHVAHDLHDGTQWKQTLLPEGEEEIRDAIHLFVSDEHGYLVNQPAKQELINALNLVKKLKFQAPEMKAGSVTVGDSVFIWSSAAVPNHNKILTLLRQANISPAKSFFRELGVSLIVAAVLMLWVASWAAMYVSMLIEKLDEQKNILKHRSLHDVLTGLPNRALLNDRLQQLIRMKDREPIQFSVCFIDLNRFKDVNDTLGHDIGDALLLEVSTRLRSSLRKDDTVARLGGDEFALILKHISKDEAELVAEKLFKEIEKPILIKDHKLFISGSMGVAMYPEHGDDVNTLLKNADVAMYAAKRSNTHLEFYSNTQEVFTQGKLELTHDLREAITKDELELYYQPKYDVAARKVVGVEALLRWKHPELGYIPPLEFIPLAEHSGLIKPLSDWVMRRAFKDLEHLGGLSEDFAISINLSAIYLQNQFFESDISEMIKEYNIDASKIILEITESAIFINSHSTNDLLDRLTKMGFRISVDDFGTGYSTLTNLRRLPISELKIDRSFVDRIAIDSEDASIVDAMIGLGESLDISVVAEGVETQEVLEALKEFGCFTIQGYIISKPVPLEEFLNWVETEKTRHLRLA